MNDLQNDRTKYLGYFIKHLREALELTQQDISNETNYSIQTISKFENGHSNPHSFASRAIADYVKTLAKLQDINVEDTYDEFCACLEDMDRRGISMP